MHHWREGKHMMTAGRGSCSAVMMAVAATLALTGCGTSSPHAATPSGPPAGCTRAGEVAAAVNAEAQHFTSVSTQGDVTAAEFAVAADSSITGSEASNLADIAAARAGAGARLAGPLGKLAAGYRALETDLN